MIRRGKVLLRFESVIDVDTQRTRRQIADVKFNTYGCASAIATSSMATDMIKGKPISEALKLTNKAVVEALDGLPAVKIHCSVLAEEAIKAAIKDYYEKNGIEYDKELFKEDCCNYEHHHAD